MSESASQTPKAPSASQTPKATSASQTPTAPSALQTPTAAGESAAKTPPPFCKLTAYLRPFGWENIADALLAAGAPGMTAIEAAGAGEAGNKMLPRIELEIVAEKAQIPALIAVLREEMFTGEKGDGKITVAPVEQAIRISTGESGAEAI